MPRSRSRTKSKASPRPPGMRLWDLLTITDQTDDQGRLLLEDSAPADAIARVEAGGISMETVPVAYE
ncbi:MAG: hypothetical protein ACRDIU_02895, partial [Actinomycetota bacterium]